MPRYSSQPWLLFVLLFVTVVAVKPAAAIPASELAAAIDAIIAQPQFDRSEWGLLIVRANNTATAHPLRPAVRRDHRVLYRRNAAQYFTPASNNKVPTTAAAFLYLGPNHTLATRLSSSSPSLGANASTICIQGAGDASFSTAVQLANLARQLYATGVRSIESLLFNDLAFPPEPPATWEWDDLQAAYGARPNSLILDENAVHLTVVPTTEGSPPIVLFDNAADNACVSVVNTAQTLAKGASTNLVVAYRLGSSALQVSGGIGVSSSNSSFVVAALDPAQRFMCATNFTLTQQGISVKSAAFSSSCGTNSTSQVWYELFTIESPQLRYTMNYTLQESNNLFAECTLRSLGVEYNQSSPRNAEQNGIAAVSAILANAGVDVSAFRQYDGSGLSRHDLMSPQAMVEIFQLMQSFPEYKSFLPVAGESGTLKNRFVGTTAQGIVHAKTGTVSGVTSLSGYVDNPALPVIFSIIVNFSNQPSSIIRQGVDNIVVLLSQLTQG